MQWPLHLALYKVRGVSSYGAWIACAGVNNGWEKASYTLVFDCLILWGLFVSRYNTRLYTTVGRHNVSTRAHAYNAAFGLQDSTAEGEDANGMFVFQAMRCRDRDTILNRCISITAPLCYVYWPRASIGGFFVANPEYFHACWYNLYSSSYSTAFSCHRETLRHAIWHVRSLRLTVSTLEVILATFHYQLSNSASQCSGGKHSRDS